MAEEVNHCKFFVVRKKRYCRMLVRKSEMFCSEHSPLNTNEFVTVDQKIRIPCPFDNKHTCFSHKLKKHLKICNARPKAPDPYIVKGINSGTINENGTKTSGVRDIVTLSDKPVSEIMKVIHLIDKVYKENTIEIAEKICTHDVVENEMKNPIYGVRTKKHLKQVSSILGLLLHYDLLKEDTCFVEFGAGRGALSYWISRATSDTGNILLVEKASPKHKKDNKLDKSSAKIQRIRADISDLVLEKVDLVKESKRVVGVTKHLCGAATDFTIRCLLNSVNEKNVLKGFIMSFCCHHRCTWASFVGREYFQELGFSEDDFQIMCGMVSWATCGTGLSRERRAEIAESKATEQENMSSIGLSADHKEEIGLKCKNLMNWGRMQYVKDAGFDSFLHYYVSNDVTPENVCIVATNKKDI